MVYGSVVLDDDDIALPIAHNLGSLDYFVSVRNRTTVYGENYANGAVAVGTALPLAMHYKVNGAFRTVASQVYESRVSSSAIYPPTNYLNLLDDNFAANSMVMYPRTMDYKWKAGTYDWVAINLGSAPDAQGTVTLDNERTVTVEHGLGTADIVLVFYCDEPILTRNGIAGAFFDPWNKSWFDANNRANGVFAFKSAASYADYTINSMQTSYGNGVTAETFTVAESFNGSLLSDGVWHWKAWKINI